MTISEKLTLALAIAVCVSSTLARLGFDRDTDQSETIPF